MNIRERAQIMEIYQMQQDRLPEWARAEGLEKCMPYKTLQEAAGFSRKKSRLFSKILERITRGWRGHADQVLSPKAEDLSDGYLRGEGLSC